MDSRRALCHAAAMWPPVTTDHARDSCLSHLRGRDLYSVYAKRTNTHKPPHCLSSRHITSTRGCHLLAACPLLLQHPPPPETEITTLHKQSSCRRVLSDWLRHCLLFGLPSALFATPTRCEGGKRLTATS